MGHGEGRPGVKNGTSKVMEVRNLREQGAQSPRAEPRVSGSGDRTGQSRRTS